MYELTHEVMPLTRLLTEREVAELLKVSPGCLRHWRMEQRGPAFLRVGSLIRYEWSAIQQWLAEGTKRWVMPMGNGRGQSQ
jgi:predicted DNA-binding transcriptional regulator AlpA